ncbi:unnamed protein product [Peniophora sp. CBMAI 1063]|nr:unnamed protein product [Peniophora sp. CBMAI 1063]
MESETAIAAENSQNKRVLLPDDIISEIYYVLAQLHPPRLSRLRGVDWRAEPGALGWIVLTHVNHQWRIVGLDMSVLWAGIVCMFPRGLETICQRAKSTPLTLDFARNTAPGEVWDALANAVDRARVIINLNDNEFEMGTRKPERDWSTIFSNRSFPYLEHLSVIFSRLTDPGSAQSSFAQMPALRSLSTNLPLAITAHSLTILNAAGCVWRVNMLLESLSVLKSLEELTIGSLYNDVKADPLWGPLKETLETVGRIELRTLGPKTVDLLKLSSLTFSNADLQACRLLHYINAPLCSKLQTGSVRSQLALSGLLARLDKCAVPKEALSIVDFAVYHDEEILDVYFTETTPYCDMDFDEHPFTRGVHLEYDVEHDSNALLFVLGAISFPRTIRTIALEHVCADMCSGCRWQQCGGVMKQEDPHALTAALLRFRNVETLYLIGSENSTHVHTLLGPNAPDNRWIFPALRELIITVNFPTSGAWWSNLESALLARQMAGMPLSRLVVRGPGACHVYVPGTGAEQAAVIKTVTKDLKGNDALKVWLRHCEVILGREEQLTLEIVDERDLGNCGCARRIVKREYTWDYREVQQMFV